MYSIPMKCDLQALKPIFERKKLSIDPCQWRITIGKDDDIVWSIVLAYLNSFPSFNIADHIEPILALKVEKRTIKQAKKYNPFLYKNDCFSNDVLITWVQTFRKRIDDYYAGNKDSFASSHKNYICLQASSVLMACNIILIQEPVREASIKGFVKVFPDCLPHANHPKTLIIFLQLKYSKINPNVGSSEDKSNMTVESFSFCLPMRVGFQKQTQVLKEILHRNPVVPFPRNRNNICILINDEENFSISLLKRQIVEFTTCVYKSPFLLSKLCDAAIETDPSIDNKHGKSALFYALEIGKPNLCYFLVNHVVNIRLLDQVCIRYPDPVMNLDNIKKHLKELQTKVKSYCMSETTKEKSLMYLSELCRFNEFEIDIRSSINNIQQRINLYYDCFSSHEAERRKDIVMIILEIYEKYFEWEDDLDQSNDNFNDHRVYFDNLDFCSAIIFVDNFFLLMERVQFSIKINSKFASQFILLIYRKKYFEKIVEKNPLLGHKLIFEARLSLKTQLHAFKKELENEMIHDENRIDKLSENTVETFKNLPKIYDQMLLLKLDRYLTCATSIHVADIKSILIIQRALQVIGECIAETSFKTVQKIIPLIFDDNLVQILKPIRNALTNPKYFDIHCRYIAEKRMEHFRKIQFELKTLKRILNPLISYHKHINNQDYQNWLISTLKTLENDAIWGLSSVDFDTLTVDINVEDGQKFYSEETYKYMIKNLFRSIHMNLKIKNMINIIELKDLLDDYIWSTEYLSMHIIKDNALKTILQNLLNRLKDKRDMELGKMEQENYVFPSIFCVEIVLDIERWMAQIFTYKTFIVPKKFQFNAIKEFMLNLYHEFNLNCKEMKMRFQDNEIVYILPKRTLKEVIYAPLAQREFKRNLEELPLKEKELYLGEGIQENANSSIEYQESKKTLFQGNVLESKAKKITLGSFKEAILAIVGQEEFKKKSYKLTEKEDVLYVNKETDQHPPLQKIKVCHNSNFLKTVSGKKCEVHAYQLEFLRNRIKHLKEILIDDNRELKQFWETAKCSRNNTCVLERTIHVFLNEPGIQASVEMLLFDCMNILKTKDLENLWHQTTNLFNSINLRTLLANGDPLLESLGRFLDPYDLPSQLVHKVLDLISDLEAINCMLKILTETGNNFYKFMEVINTEGEFMELREKIFESENWEQYVFLIAYDESYKNMIESKLLTDSI